MPTPKTAKKTTQRKNLYLFLTIAFFLAIIAIFVFDGYMGVYDTVSMTTQEREEVIEPDYWSRDYPQSTWTTEGQDIYFRYELDNRWLSSYAADIEISVWSANMEVSPWRAQERVLDLVSEPIVVTPFGKSQVEGVLDTGKLELGQIPPDQDEYSVKYSVIIKHGEIERKVLLLFVTKPRPPLE